MEAIRAYKKPVKVYQASSSEMIGATPPGKEGCNEDSPFYPRSPYGCAKVFAYWITRNYRESYGLHLTNGILFNHESKRRGLEFVTRKITNGVAKIYLDLEKEILLGNLDSRRDWGHSEEYMHAAWLMLQQDTPDDYVIATGKSYSIRDFLDLAFEHIGISDWSSYVKQDPKYLRPAEVDHLLGDYSKAKEKLGWEPKKTLKDIVDEMVENDIQLLKSQLNHNYNLINK
jgi:GDPmannose 4,6-dehydratase